MRGQWFLILMILLVALISLSLLFFLKVSDADSVVDYSGKSIQNSLESKGVEVVSSQERELAISKDRQATSEELVVDQSSMGQEGSQLPMISLPSNEKAIKVPSVLGAVKEEVTLTLTLLNGLDQKPLAGLSGELRVRYANQKEENSTLTADENGKVQLKAFSAGYVSIQFSSKTYALYSSILFLNLGKNEHALQLLKGGRLEVIVKTLDCRSVEGVVAEIQMETQRREITLLKNSELLYARVEFNYDSARGVYVVDDLREGKNVIRFKASGYVDTAFYHINIDSEKPGSFEISLVPVRKILFDLEVEEKPDRIYLSESQVFKTNRARLNQQLKLSKEVQINVLPGVQSDSLHVSFRKSISDVLQHRRSQGSQMSNDQKILLKNKARLYEYEITNPDLVSVLLFTRKYAPAEVMLTAEKDFYKVSLRPCLAVRVYIKNEKGESVADAGVRYSAPGVALSTTTSDREGVVRIENIGQATQISLQILHKDYAAMQLTWDLEENEEASKTVTLLKGYQISGNVFFQNQSIANAKVFLYQLGSSAFVDFVTTNSYGEFSFQSLAKATDRPYTLKAFHKDYGVAVVSSILFEDQDRIIDLEVKEEKSGVLKFVTDQHKPAGKIGFTLINTSDPDFSAECATDEHGVYSLMNMLHGSYYVSLNSAQYDAEKELIQLPANTITIVVRDKRLCKLTVTVEDGRVFQGALRVSFLSDTLTAQELNVIKDEKGERYLDLVDMHLSFAGFIVIEAQGYVPSILEYRAIAQVALDELTVPLKEGSSLSVRVIDDRTGAPLVGVAVAICAQREIQIQTLPTNSFGEVSFRNLPDEFAVIVNESKYGIYHETVKIKDSKVLEVRLKYGGGIKGHVTLHKEIKLVLVRLDTDYLQVLNEKGQFEFAGLPSGNYTLKVTAIYKDDRVVSKEVANLFIEENKVLVLNLDNYLKE